MTGNALFMTSKSDNELHYLRERVKYLEVESNKNSTSEKKISYMQISELLTKYQELYDEKRDLETRFTTENVRFFELVEKMRDRLRLIALSTMEMESKIRILNSKVPELEDISSKHDKTIEDLSYKLRTANIKEIRDLEKAIKHSEHNIKYLENEILKIKKKNKDLKTEFDALTQESTELKNQFEKQQEAMKENITKLEHDNCQLEKKLDKIVDVNKETYIQKIHCLEKELNALTSQIKRTRSDKISLVGEMTLLKNELKKLVLHKVSSVNK